MSNETSQVKSCRQQSALPTRKVLTSGVTGAVTVIIIYVLNTYVLPEPIPVEIGSAIATILSFGMAWIVPPAASDQIVPQW